MNRCQCRSLPSAPRSVGPLMVGLLLLVLAPGSLAAQQGLGFEVTFGYQGLSGDYGDVLKGGIDSEFVLAYTRGRLRYGLGANWASYDMEAPNEDESWSNIASHLGLAFYLLAEGRVRPFIEARVVGRRLRPENHFLGGQEDPEEPGENTSPIRVFGVSGAAVAGVEIGLSRRSWAKLAGYAGTINTESADLGDINLGAVDSGRVFGFRVGIFWTL